MELTPEILDRYTGGQAEIQNAKEGYLYRGEIQEISIKSGSLVIRFAWLAKGEGFPPFPDRWVNCTHLDYTAGLLLYSASDIGSDRIALSCRPTDELTVLYPAGGSTLDPAEVEGLELASD